MWIFTKDGFFSVVKDKYCKKHEVMVRARVKEDLKQLEKRMRWKEGTLEIIELSHADYRYRAKMTTQEWNCYLGFVGDDIDYSNVKGTIVNGDSVRAYAYMETWSAMHDFQQTVAGLPPNY